MAAVSRALPTIEELLQLVDVRDGRVFWLERSPSQFRRPVDCQRWNSNFAGAEAGSVNSDGYCVVGLTHSGRRLAVKRSHIIWAAATGAWPDGIIDHANGVRDDDRMNNLRPASVSENVRNTAPAQGRSGVRGVYKSRRGWSSMISTDGGRVYLGEFATIDEAGEAYKAAAGEEHRQFAYHNRGQAA
jgi:HNH endonuclease